MKHKRFLLGGLAASAAAIALTATLSPLGANAVNPESTADEPTAEAAENRVVGYYTDWSTYQRDFQVKDLDTSGAADELTHIVYAFGNVTNGKCAVGDSYADHEKKTFTAEQSVSGEADTWDQEVAGNINQLRQLKEKHPQLKVLWSFGGWTWSGGFGEASKDPAAFAASCHDLVEDERWADVFSDGIDIDWEYPNATGLSEDTSGFDAYRELLSAVRTEFGDDLVTSRSPPTAPRAARSSRRLRRCRAVRRLVHADDLRLLRRLQRPGPDRAALAADRLRRGAEPGLRHRDRDRQAEEPGHPGREAAAGHRFLRPRWTGVTQDEPGGTATGAAPGTYEAGIEDYKVLKDKCPATGEVAGTAYAHCGDQWWSYDTPETIAGKTAWAKEQSLGGSFFWDLSGDTDDAELTKAVSNGLK